MQRTSIKTMAMEIMELDAKIRQELQGSAPSSNRSSRSSFAESAGRGRAETAPQATPPEREPSLGSRGRGSTILSTLKQKVRGASFLSHEKPKDPFTRNMSLIEECNKLIDRVADADGELSDKRANYSTLKDMLVKLKSQKLDIDDDKRSSLNEAADAGIKRADSAISAISRSATIKTPLKRESSSEEMEMPVQGSVIDVRTLNDVLKEMKEDVREGKHDIGKVRAYVADVVHDSAPNSTKEHALQRIKNYVGHCGKGSQQDRLTAEIDSRIDEVKKPKNSTGLLFQGLNVSSDNVRSVLKQNEQDNQAALVQAAAPRPPKPLPVRPDAGEGQANDVKPIPPPRRGPGHN